MTFMHCVSMAYSQRNKYFRQPYSWSSFKRFWLVIILFVNKWPSFRPIRFSVLTAWQQWDEPARKKPKSCQPGPPKHSSLRKFFLRSCTSRNKRSGRKRRKVNFSKSFWVWLVPICFIYCNFCASPRWYSPVAGPGISRTETTHPGKVIARFYLRQSDEAIW